MSSDGPSARYFAADGEKLSTSQIAATHVPHPGVQPFFPRSTLLIGTRGSGKTFLLRHRKATTHDGAIYVNLVSALQPLSREGLGGRTLHLPDSIADSVRAKTSALVAASVLDRLAADGEEALTADLLGPLVPPGVTDHSDLAAMRKAIGRIRLEDWGAVSGEPWELAEVLSDVSGLITKPLAVFLDRAEDIPSASMDVILPLLDQSHSFLSVIAARPGLSSVIPARVNSTLVAGDHFDILHLGIQPYEDQWTQFSLDAVARYLMANEVNIPSGVDVTWATRMARDSIRSAIEYAQLALLTGAHADGIARRASRMREARDQHMSTVKAELLPEHDDFQSVLRLARKRAGARLRSGRQVSVVIGIDQAGEQVSLLRSADRSTAFLLKALRCEALYLPPGSRWHPYELPSQFEVPPLFAWNGENTAWIR